MTDKEKLQKYVGGIISDPNSQVAQMADYVVADVFLPKLIKSIEQDARERAMNVYVKSCHYSNKGRVGWCNLYESIHECRPERCARLSEFLKNYDND